MRIIISESRIERTSKRRKSQKLYTHTIIKDTHLCLGDAAGSSADGVDVSLGLPARLAGIIAPSLVDLLVVALGVVPLRLSREEAPGGGRAVVGSLRSLCLCVVSESLDDGIGSTLGLPAWLARIIAPALVLLLGGFSLGLGFGAGVALVLPAWLAWVIAPRFGVALGLGVAVGGEGSLEVEAAVVFSVVVPSGEGDDVGELVDLALGLEGGAAGQVAQISFSIGVSGSSLVARDLEDLGEGLSCTLNLPAGLARIIAPGLGFSVSIGITLSLLPARLSWVVTPRAGLGLGSGLSLGLGESLTLGLLPAWLAGVVAPRLRLCVRGGRGHGGGSQDGQSCESELHDGRKVSR